MRRQISLLEHSPSMEVECGPNNKDESEEQQEEEEP
jgi:hypothetical protein